MKAALQERLPGTLVVRGEISGWKRPTSGHCYFSLKDESGVLDCMMWSSRFSKVKFEPENGMAVLATGYVDVYMVRGRYQLYVEKLEPEGVGALRLAYEQMVKKLQTEGLFADEHKKPLPAFPERIGILTSESGAAVHDIADSVHNRWPFVKLYLYPVSVQGPGAAESIAAAIRDVNRRNDRLELDTLIVGRGGGSLEDLWAFNEEVVARAIFASQIPVISAVGHEVDTTIADFVADARASTPTKAGMVAVPDKREVLGRLRHCAHRLNAVTSGKLQLADARLEQALASWVFRNPLVMVQEAGQRADELSQRLAEAMRGIVEQARRLLGDSYEQVVKLEPSRLMATKRAELVELDRKMAGAMAASVERRNVRLCDLEAALGAGVKDVLARRRLELTARENMLAGLNPKSVLKRGYSITTNKKTGKVVRKADDAAVGDTIITELAEEQCIESEVKRQKG